MPDQTQNFSDSGKIFPNLGRQILEKNDESKKHMKTITKFIYSTFAALALVCFALSPTVQADQIVLNSSSVIGGSGCYSDENDNLHNAWNNPGHPFNAFQVVDNQGAASIDEPFATGYWLGKQADFQEYFVVDLGAVYNLGWVYLFNTHNGFAFDRATGNFQIYISNAVIPNTSGEGGAGGMDLSGATLAISGTLNMPANPISSQTFVFPPGTVARYLRFNALDGAIGATQGVGLNEIQVFGTLALTYAAQVQQPINADGTSVFSVRRGVVPVKFTLTQGGVATCALPPATIAVTRTAGGTTGPIDESIYIGSADTGSNFRIDSCQYIYNLNSSALGVGTYRVDIMINGQVVGSATFQLK
jgi:hypothetical protein